MFSTGIEHNAAFACPTPVTVADIHHSESAHSASPEAEVAYIVGHFGSLVCLILHGALAVDHDAYGDAVAVAHKGVGASYRDAADGA